MHEWMADDIYKIYFTIRANQAYVLPRTAHQYRLIMTGYVPMIMFVMPNLDSFLSPSLQVADKNIILVK